MRVQSVNLNLIPTGVMPIVHLSQYDRDADGALLFNIFNGPTPYNLTGCTATINGTKPDGNVYTYPCTVHSNFLTSAVYDQMTTVQGTHEAEIRISDGDSVVGTLNFQMAIEKAGVSEIDVSHTDVPTLLEDIQNSVNEAEYWAEQAAGAVAGVASFNGRHGSVLPVAGDYDASQISYGGSTVKEALDNMGGGHTILNASGQEMPQRKNLRFTGANVSDDAEDDTTNVTIQGGAGGSTITVSTIETSLYGETVTITDGTATFTGVFDNTGVCVISGVTATGTLTVTSGAATRQLTAPYYGNYEVALSFWSAEITVTTDPGVNSAIVKKDGVNVGTISFSAGTGTYIAGSTGAYTFTATVGGVEFTSPTVNVTEQTSYSTSITIWSATLNISTGSSALYGKTITIKKGSTTVGTTAFSAQGSASYTVHETGTYTCECEGYSGSATVSAETTYNVTINARLDLSSWITAGSTTEYPLNPSSYADFAALEADEAAVRQLMLVHNAVDYLATASAGDSLMQSVINSDVCAKWINLRDYALDTLSANANIKSVMDTADKYGYGEIGAVNIATDTTKVSASGQYSSDYAASKAINTAPASGNKGWISPGGGSNAYLDYDCGEDVSIAYINIGYCATSGASTTARYKIQGKKNGSSEWVDLTNEYTSILLNQWIKLTPIVSDTFRYYRLLEIERAVGGSGWVIQYCKYQPLGNVPIMTANNAPYGEVSTNAGNYTTYYPYLAFQPGSTGWASSAGQAVGNYLRYMFVNPSSIKKVDITVGLVAGSKFKIQGYNGSTWEDVGEEVSHPTAGAADFTITNNSDTYYMGIQLIVTSVGAGASGSSCSAKNFQFYGRELSPLVPTMTGNTTPKGTASGSIYSTVYEGHEPFRAFDNDESTSWLGVYNNNIGSYLEYEFPDVCKPVMIKYVPYLSGIYNRIGTFKIQGYIDNAYEDATDALDGTVSSTNIRKVFVLDSVKQYTKCKFIILTSNSGDAGVSELQYYGFDYSEKEFATGSTRKTIYDHGVKPSGAITGGTDDGNNLTLSAVGTAVVSLSFTAGDYTYMGGKVGLRASGTNRLVCGSGYSAFTSSNMPDSNGFDISSVGGTVSVGIEQTASGTFDCEEVWIE